MKWNYGNLNERLGLINQALAGAYVLSAEADVLIILDDEGENVARLPLDKFYRVIVELKEPDSALVMAGVAVAIQDAGNRGMRAGTAVGRDLARKQLHEALGVSDIVENLDRIAAALERGKCE